MACRNGMATPVSESFNINDLSGEWREFWEESPKNLMPSVLEASQRAGKFWEAWEGCQLGFSVLGVPEQLEIEDQRRAEVAVGLLASIERGVLTEQVERLGGKTQRPAIADRAHGARAGQA